MNNICRQNGTARLGMNEILLEPIQNPLTRLV